MRFSVPSARWFAAGRARLPDIAPGAVPDDEAHHSLFGFLHKKKSVGTAAQVKGEGLGETDESAVAAQADAGRSIGGGGYSQDKHGLIKRKKYKNLRNKPRVGQRSFLGITF